MSHYCANPSCSVPLVPNQGKLFCAEIEIGSASSAARRTTTRVWLCDGCARQMKSYSEVASDVIRALLADSCASYPPIQSMIN
jgi:hypothetical protein